MAVDDLDVLFESMPEMFDRIVLPTDWDGFTMSYRHRDTQYQIEVHQIAAGSARTLRLDGALLPDDRVLLVDDGQEHRIALEHPRTS